MSTNDYDFEEDDEKIKVVEVPPLKSKLKPNKSPLEISASDSADDGIWLTSYADLMTLVACFFILLVAFSNFDPQSFSRKSSEMAKHFSGENKSEKEIEDSKEQIAIAIKEDPLFNNKVTTEMEMDGLAINFSGSALFESGQANVRGEIKDALDIMIDMIHEKQPGAKIIIEGHTDSMPVANSSFFKSNWELSVIRAAKVIERFEKFGFKPENLTAVGYGSTRPLKPNFDKDGLPNFENMQENRRIIIKVLDNSKMMKRQKLGLGVYLDDKLIEDGQKKPEIEINGEKISP